LSRSTDTELVQALADVCGHHFASAELLRGALTHPSAAGRRRDAQAKQRSYERLEFLRDRVLGLVLTDLLLHAFPAEPEGALARRLAALAREDTLAGVATTAGLGPHLTLSRAEAAGGGRDNPAILADACEAMIGALYLDGGLAAAAAFIRRYWEPPMAAEARPPQDAKTALQEWAQAAGLPLPMYRTVRTEGPPHEPLFAVEVQVAGRPPASATGRSKRTAEQAAAGALLTQLRAASDE